MRAHQSTIARVGLALTRGRIERLGELLFAFAFTAAATGAGIIVALLWLWGRP